MQGLRIQVGLTKEQHAVLAKAAEAVGLTISAYLRAAALSKAASEATPQS